jgi:RNA polymerase sigma factor (sigma-70 family)
LQSAALSVSVLRGVTPPFSSALLRTQSDERLLKLVGAGQERAFEAIVHRYRSPLERYCTRALSRSQGEDVVQQVLLKAWEALSNGAEVRSLRPWLFRIAQTTIIDTVQHSGFDYDELADSLSPLDEPDSEFERRAVIRQTLMGLAALPEAQRQALLRTAIVGQSRAEIAQALGVSEGAVRQLLYRARTSLRSVATAITPLPLVTWMASPVEVGGLAKASAIVAGAGIVAAGPVAVHELPLSHPDRARPQIQRPAAPQRARLAGVSRVLARSSYQASVVAAKPRELRNHPESTLSRTRSKSLPGDHETVVTVPARDDAPGPQSRPAEEAQEGARDESSPRTRRHRDRVRDDKARTRKQPRKTRRAQTSPADNTRGNHAENTRKEKVERSPSEPDPGVPPDENGPTAKGANGPPVKETKAPQ